MKFLLFFVFAILCTATPFPCSDFLLSRHDCISPSQFSISNDFAFFTFDFYFQLSHLIFTFVFVTSLFSVCRFDFSLHTTTQFWAITLILGSKITNISFSNIRPMVASRLVLYCVYPVRVCISHYTPGILHLTMATIFNIRGYWRLVP